MFEFLMGFLMVGALCLILCAVCEALSLVAAHLRGNPEAVKAIVEHVFMPLFGDKKEPEGKSPPGTAMVVCKASAEEPPSDN